MVDKLGQGAQQNSQRLNKVEPLRDVATVCIRGSGIKKISRLRCLCPQDLTVTQAGPPVRYRKPQIIAGRNTAANPAQISAHAAPSSQARTAANGFRGGPAAPAIAPDFQRQRNDSGQEAQAATQNAAPVTTPATFDRAKATVGA